MTTWWIALGALLILACGLQRAITIQREAATPTLDRLKKIVDPKREAS